MRERIALSNPTQTAVKALRDPVKISLCRSAMRRDIFEIYFVMFCNLRIAAPKKTSRGASRRRRASKDDCQQFV
jgi:hypothetical protein